MQTAVQTFVPEEADEEVDEDESLEVRGQPESWFLETGELSDITVRCGRKSFQLHKYVLCRESRWFLDKIMKEKENEIDLLEDEEHFQQLCHLMYCEGVVEECYDDTIVAKMHLRKFNERICLGICACAYNLGCSKVIMGCRRFFNVTLETASAIHFLKGSWGIDSLTFFKDRSLALMVQRFENYLGDDNIGILQNDALCEIMRKASQRKPRPPPERTFCSIACRNAVLQDALREISKPNINEMFTLLPVINFEDVCDLLIQCGKHGCEENIDRCIPVLAAHAPDVDSEKAFKMPRKVVLKMLRHESISDIDHAYTFGRDYLLKEMPALHSMIQSIDKHGGHPKDQTRRPRVGTEDWYGLEILDTLFLLKNRIRKRELETSRNLPQFRVMIICAELFEDYREDVRFKLVQAGCSKVEMVLGHLRNPSLEQLLTFHSVLVWSNANFQDPEGLGDVLADAADEGVGIVLCAYSLRESPEESEKAMSIGGRLMQSYMPCTRGFVDGGFELQLKPHKRDLQEHPECLAILDGVTHFSGGTESIHQILDKIIGLSSAVIVAEWSNAVPAVVVNLPSARRRASIVVWNCRPGSSDISAHGWTSGNEGQRLMFNMLKFASAMKTEAKCIV